MASFEDVYSQYRADREAVYLASRKPMKINAGDKIPRIDSPRADNFAVPAIDHSGPLANDADDAYRQNRRNRITLADELAGIDFEQTDYPDDDLDITAELQADNGDDSNPLTRTNSFEQVYLAAREYKSATPKLDKALPRPIQYPALPKQSHGRPKAWRDWIEPSTDYVDIELGNMNGMQAREVTSKSKKPSRGCWTAQWTCMKHFIGFD